VPDVLSLLVAFLAGIGLGSFYFGALWLTVRRLPTARRPFLLTFFSFLVRLGVTMLGFYLAMGGHWERLLVCLLGFVGMRNVLTHIWGPDRKCRTLYQTR
jgi:F1F0 ATPase subunit 2